MKTIENSFSAASLSVQSQHFLQSSAVGPADQLTNPSKTQVINCLKSFWYFCEPFMTQSATHRVCVCDVHACWPQGLSAKQVQENKSSASVISVCLVISIYRSYSLAGPSRSSVGRLKANALAASS